SLPPPTDQRSVPLPLALEAQGRIDPARSAPTRTCLAHPVGSPSPGTQQLTGEQAHLDNSGSTASCRTGYGAPPTGPASGRRRPHAARANAVPRPGSKPDPPASRAGQRRRTGRTPPRLPTGFGPPPPARRPGQRRRPARIKAASARTQAGPTPPPGPDQTRLPHRPKYPVGVLIGEQSLRIHLGTHPLGVGELGVGGSEV